MRLTVLRVLFALLEELMIMKVALRFAIMEFGEQSAMTFGVQMMVKWLAVNWALTM